MSLTFFLLKKYSGSDKNFSGFKVFSGISILGITFGVATLIIALSILNGYKNVIREKLISFNAHLQITGFSERDLPDYKKTISEIEQLLPGIIENIQPVVQKTAIAGKGRMKEGVSIKGVTKEYIKSLGLRGVNTSSLFYYEGETMYIIPGEGVAKKLLIKPGDKITIFASNTQNLSKGIFDANVERYLASPPFQSGMGKIDESVIFMDIDEAIKLFKTEGMVSGLEIKLSNIENLDSLRNLLQDNLKYPHYVSTFYDNYRFIFTWIELQSKPIPLILGLIIIVATFNIISTMLILVLERTQAIGTLKALGVKNGLIARLFLFRGVMIGVAGIAFGNILAYLLLYLQQTYELIKLPSNVYFVSSVPVGMQLSDFILVSAVSLPVCIIMSLLPAYIASRLKPVSVMRFG
ncbi:MAG: ABC transporter permease [Ignavibacteriaceae bacterium]|nr:ABC transporter permease [Ignavibacteriaceae bacterium]